MVRLPRWVLAVAFGASCFMAVVLAMLDASLAWYLLTPILIGVGLLLVLMFLDRHKHNWNLIDKEVIPPAHDANRRFTAHDSESVKAFLEAGRPKVVYAFKCDDCGKVKVIRK